ncbi:FtsW/RodA/SpoVE family cell cycle protein [Pseudahrensia aquimaris]|uniref:Probable peptidoglycan glycosyltransferase FtsW n=1 Tax=Pseudahrensia aquimaris TaxID=744461 RepID=A0ABW3FDK1_9HYPH
MVSRARKGVISDWWWTVDKLLLAALLGLMFMGLLLSLSASPPVAKRLGIDAFHFVERHAMFMLPAIGVLIGTSLLTMRQARRVAFIVLGASIVALLLIPFIGFSAKGATRWLAVGSFLIQPSEFMKPAFVVITAWLFSESVRQPDIPCNALAIGLFGLCAGLLVMQPDLGQTLLLSFVWGAMFFMAGMPWLWVALLGGTALTGLTVAYFSFSHFSGRIDRFLTGAGDTFQVDRGLAAINNGGWLGTGPGEGRIKNGLPDSHTDFIFSVTVEEFGIVLAMGLVLIFAFIVMRGLWHALREHDRFVQLAVSGLVLQFGFQAMINIGVNLRLLPAKGMTLPFISYGGSSLLAVAFGMGLVLALTRKRADSYSRGWAKPAGATAFAV